MTCDYCVFGFQGEKFNITKEEFLTTSSVLSQEKSRAEAVAALNKKLMVTIFFFFCIQYLINDRSKEM